MHMRLDSALAIAAIALAVGCSQAPPHETPDAAPPPVVGVEGQVIYDFSAFPDGFGSPNSSVAFPIDLTHPVNTITAPTSGRIMTIYDRGGCWAEDVLRLGIDSVRIPDGAPAIVTEVDLVLKETTGTAPKGVCFGYLQVDGTWHFDLRIVEPAVSASGEMTAKLVVPPTAISAMEIAREDVYGPNIVRMTLHAQPATR